MAEFDKPNLPIEGQPESVQVPQTAWEAFAHAKQKRLALLENIDRPELKKLAEKQLTELTTLETQKTGDEAGILEARKEFEMDIKALDTIEEKFGSLDNFRQFTSFLSSGELSPNELERLYWMIHIQLKEDDAEELAMEFEFEGFPLNRESYTLFANKFGIPTSTQKTEEQAKLMRKDEQLYLSKLPNLQFIDGVPEVQTLVWMFQKLQLLEGTDAQTQMQAIVHHLVWPNGQWGKIDTILTALKKKDAENIADGKPTKYFETFTRTARDFSPDVAKRIDVFVASYEAKLSTDGQPASPYKRAIIAWAIPDGSNIETNKAGEFVANLSDGTDIIVLVDGDLITRSMNLEGANIPIKTDIERADFSAALGEYETIRQDLAPKYERSQNALSFLKNPNYADVPLAEMKDWLMKILGYTMYGNLWVASLTDKQALIATLKTNVDTYTSKLTDAEKVYSKALKQAIAKNQERYRERDEKIKTTLRAIRNSGLGLLDVEYLIANIKAGLLTPEIWVSTDRQNYDLTNQNFWETLQDTQNPSKHIEYIYRFANKVMTGSPDGIVDGQLVGFSLEQVILNPGVALKTDGEVRHLLEKSGVWSQTTGVNKTKMKEKLEEPVKV